MSPLNRHLFLGAAVLRRWGWWGGERPVRSKCISQTPSSPASPSGKSDLRSTEKRKPHPAKSPLCHCRNPPRGHCDKLAHCQSPGLWTSSPSKQHLPRCYSALKYQTPYCGRTYAILSVRRFPCPHTKLLRMSRKINYSHSCSCVTG